MLSKRIVASSNLESLKFIIFRCVLHLRIVKKIERTEIANI